MAVVKCLTLTKPKYIVKNRAPPTNKIIMVGIPVPKKLCKIKPSHQFATGVKASLIRSSKPFS